MNKVLALHRRLAMHAEEIAAYFVPGMRITIIARFPGQTEQEVVVSDDAKNNQLDEVIKVLERTKMRNEGKLESSNSVN